MNESMTLLPTVVPVPAWFLLAVGATASWFLVRRIRARKTAPILKTALFVLGMLTACAASWIFFGLVATVATIDHTLATWKLPLLTGVAIELVVLMYRRERSVLPYRVGLLLTTLRLVLVALLVLILLKPTIEQVREQTFERTIAVLVDRSASMRVRDAYPAAATRFEVADMFDDGEPLERPAGFDDESGRLAGLADRVAALWTWLEYARKLEPVAREHQVGLQNDDMRAACRASVDEVVSVLQTMDALVAAQAASLSGATQALQVARAALATQLAPAAATALKRVEDIAVPQQAKEIHVLSGLMKLLQEKLQSCAILVGALTPQILEAHFSSLPDEERQRLTDLAAHTRNALAQAVLAKRLDGRAALLESLSEAYDVRTYRFDSSARETNLSAWAAGEWDSAMIPTNSAEIPSETLRTDLNAALKKVADEIGDRLSGVLILSDGRLTMGDSPDAAARRLATRRVPICSVMLGSPSSPPDVSVTAVEAPRNAVPGSKLTVKAGVRFEGLSGRDARVVLECDGEQVAERTLKVLSPSYQTPLEFTHSPTNEGVYVYTVRVDAMDSEQLTVNNQRSSGVSVSQLRTSMLVIDGRPRWEARYLRNLFADRDPSVQLQYLLMYPDQVGGLPALPAIPASVNRPSEEIQATALPENPDEWMKFDIIVLGDIARADLGEAGMAAVRRYVGERGGTLVMIAGDEFLPAEYLDSPLQDLFPFTYERETVVKAGQGIGQLFTIGLTDDGAAHSIMRMADYEDANRVVWNEFPEIDWWCPVVEAKPSATVLAYAKLLNVPEDEKEPGSAPPDTDARNSMERQRDLERRHALIATQAYGAGKVLMLSFDRTWRMRYRKGDKYHHKFWAQVLRWATEDRLPLGSAHVRMGTDRVQYAPDQPVRVKVHLVDAEDNPIVTEDMQVELVDENGVVASHPLAYVPDSVGLYEAALDPIAVSGRYRLVLRNPEAARILAEDGFADDLSAEILIVPDAGPELADISAAANALQRLADLTGGVCVDPRRATDVVSHFGPKSERVVHVERYGIWNSWWLLLLVLCVVTAEWLIRKRVGLA